MVTFDVKQFAQFASEVGANKVDKIFVKDEKQQVIPVDAVDFMSSTVLGDGTILRNIHISCGEQQFSFPVDKAVPQFSKPGERVTRPELKRLIDGDITICTWTTTDKGAEFVKKNNYNAKKANCYFELTDSALANYARVNAASQVLDEEFV